MNVYLSGGMEYAEGSGKNWREEIEKWLSDTLQHHSFNPVTESERFLNRRYPGIDPYELKREDVAKYSKLVGEIVSIDSNEVAHRADYVICLWDKSARDGAGTQGEITLARYFNKPVYLVTEVPHADIPGWVFGCATKIFGSFDDLKHYLTVQFNSKE